MIDTTYYQLEKNMKKQFSKLETFSWDISWYLQRCNSLQMMADLELCRIENRTLRTNFWLVAWLPRCSIIGLFGNDPPLLIVVAPGISNSTKLASSVKTLRIRKNMTPQLIYRKRQYLFRYARHFDELVHHTKMSTFNFRSVGIGQSTKCRFSDSCHFDEFLHLIQTSVDMSRLWFRTQPKFGLWRRCTTMHVLSLQERLQAKTSHTQVHIRMHTHRQVHVRMHTHTQTRNHHRLPYRLMSSTRNWKGK